MKSSHFKWLSILLICSLGLITYSNTFHCSFHFDDRFFIFENSSITDIYNPLNIWNFFPCRFITLFSIALNYHFHQLDVFDYHVFNLCVHLLSSILVWWLTLLTLSCPTMKPAIVKKNAGGKRTSLQPSITDHSNLIALLAALIFVSHPVQTEAVTYIWQRAASLVALFYLGSLCFYVQFRLLQDQKPNSSLVNFFYICSLITAILAMFTKENAVTLPLMMLLYEFYFLKTNKNIKWGQLIPFLLTIFIIPLTISLTKSTMSQNIHDVVEGTKGISPLHYLLTQFRVMMTYIRLIFIPVNQNMDYDFPVYKSMLELPVLMSFLCLTFILYLSKRLFLKYRLVSFSILWFFLTLMPESSLLPLQDMIYEHRLYLPLAGYCIFLVSGIYYLVGQRSQFTMIIALTMIISCNTILTYQRNKIWKDELTLLNDVVGKSPHKARPHNNRGKVYLDQGDLPQAMIDLNQAIELDPHYAEPRINRGLIYDKQGNLDRALSDYNKAIEIDPNFAGAYNNRGGVYNKQKKYAQALSDFTKAIELDPNFAAAYNNRGEVDSMQGHLKQAIADFTKALELDPTLDQAYYGRGLAYAGHGDSNEAISDFTKAIELKPDNAEAYNNRGYLNFQKGNFAQALSDYNKAIELNPKLEIAYINRRILLKK